MEEILSFLSLTSLVKKLLCESCLLFRSHERDSLNKGTNVPIKTASLFNFNRLCHLMGRTYII